MNMAYRVMFVASVLLCFVPGICSAQWTMDFVRITCIPEARYLQVEYKPVVGPIVLMETAFDKNKKKQRLSAWQKHGYYDPSEKITYECRMPESTYKISAMQPPAQDRGECGVSQSITLSLSRNGKPMLDKIILGDNCAQGPTVDSFEINDGFEGWETRQMTLCISPKLNTKKFCELLPETYGNEAPRRKRRGILAVNLTVTQTRKVAA
jgi:hypothetical protein